MAKARQTLAEAVQGVAPKERKRKKREEPEHVDPTLEYLQARLREADRIYNDSLVQQSNSMQAQRDLAIAAANVWQWRANIHYHLNQHDFARKASSTANDYLATAERCLRGVLSDRVSELESRVARTRNLSRVLADLPEVAE